MTKEERLEQFKVDMGRRTIHLSEVLVRELIESAFSRGYDHGFADGCTAGASHTAKTMEFVNEALFRP